MRIQWKHVGVVYKYTLTKDCPENGWVYIGETRNEKKRRYDWSEENNKSYGGKSITQARDNYGVSSSTWEYEVLEYVFSDTPQQLQADLVDREKYHIAQYKNHSVNLFNGNSGGKGRG